MEEYGYANGILMMLVFFSGFSYGAVCKGNGKVLMQIFHVFFYSLLNISFHKTVINDLLGPMILVKQSPPNNGIFLIPIA